MKSILIIAPYFPPSAASGSHRALGFVKHLPKFGWKATVVACGKRPWETEDPKLLQEIPADTPVHYVEFPLDRIRKPLPLLMQKLRIKEGNDLWIPPAVEKCQRVVQAEKPDVVLTTGPPHTVHLVGRSLQRQYDLPWVADFRDPWCSWGDETPYVENIYLFERFWERSVFRHANAVIANTENTARMFRQCFPQSANRIVAIPNGYDPVDPNHSSHESRDPKSFVLVHTGSTYAGRDPIPLVHALHKISTQEKLGHRKPLLRLLGTYGDKHLKSKLETSGLLSYVELGEQVPYGNALEALLAADLLVLFDSPGRRIGVPAKLYEYIGAGGPVLAIAEEEGDVAIVLKKSGVRFRIVSDRKNVSKLAEAIVDLDDNLTSYGRAKIIKSTDESFTRQRSACKLSEILTNLLTV